MRCDVVIRDGSSGWLTLLGIRRNSAVYRSYPGAMEILSFDRQVVCLMFGSVLERHALERGRVKHIDSRIRKVGLVRSNGGRKRPKDGLKYGLMPS